MYVQRTLPDGPRQDLPHSWREVAVMDLGAQSLVPGRLWEVPWWGRRTMQGQRRVTEHGYEIVNILVQGHTSGK